MEDTVGDVCLLVLLNASLEANTLPEAGSTSKDAWSGKNGSGGGFAVKVASALASASAAVEVEAAVEATEGEEGM